MKSTENTSVSFLAKRSTTIFLYLLLCFCSIPLISQDLSNGLTGFYPFNGNAGDSSFTAPINHGRSVGVSYVCGPIGSAVSFNGVSDHLVLDTNFFVDSAYSISLWIKPSDIKLGSFFSVRNQCANTARGWDKVQMGLITRNTSRVYNDPAVITVDNQLIFMHSRSNDNCNEWSSQHVYTIPGLQIDTSCFTHLVITVTSNRNLNRNYTVYANGIRYEDTLYSSPTSKNIDNTTDAFDKPSALFRSFIGVTHNNFLFPRNLHTFSGAIDQLRFYNRTLDADDANALYQEGQQDRQLSLNFESSFACEQEDILVWADSVESCDLFYWILNNKVVGSSDSIQFKKRANVPDTLQLVYQYRNICMTNVLSQVFYLPPTDTVFRSICSGDSTFFNGKWYKQSGIYMDTLKSPNCDSIIVLSVTEIMLELELGNDQQLCLGDSLLLDVFAPNQSYLWQDNSTAATFNVKTAGTYKVTVSNVCEAQSDSIVISTVDCNCRIKMPNVFTPNNDGLNDLLLPLPDCFYAEYHLQIFNRWGDQIFESSSSKLAWDGTHAGKNASEGVYYYRATYKTLLGTERNINGNILLLRQ